jgi:hypothetical protein
MTVVRRRWASGAAVQSHGGMMGRECCTGLVVSLIIEGSWTHVWMGWKAARDQ